MGQGEFGYISLWTYETVILHTSDIIIIIIGARLSPPDTTSTTGILYQPQTIDDGYCGAIGGIKIGRGNRSEVLEETAPMLLCPPQIPHDLTRSQTRAAAVGSQQLTAWAIAPRT
jgi:hypothetical protein